MTDRDLTVTLGAPTGSPQLDDGGVVGKLQMLAPKNHPRVVDALQSLDWREKRRESQGFLPCNMGVSGFILPLINQSIEHVELRPMIWRFHNRRSPSYHPFRTMGFSTINQPLGFSYGFPKRFSYGLGYPHDELETPNQTSSF